MAPLASGGGSLGCGGLCVGSGPLAAKMVQVASSAGACIGCHGTLDWNDKVKNVLHVKVFQLWLNSLILIATLYALAS